jgi:hypothetical protein
MPDLQWIGPCSSVGWRLPMPYLLKLGANPGLPLMSSVPSFIDDIFPVSPETCLQRHQFDRRCILFKNIRWKKPSWMSDVAMDIYSLCPRRDGITGGYRLPRKQARCLQAPEGQLGKSILPRIPLMSFVLTRYWSIRKILWQNWRDAAR